MKEIASNPAAPPQARPTRCGKCGKEFDKPCQLERHQKRKTPCAIIVDSQDLPAEARADPELDKRRCRFCGRVFKSYVSMRRHVRSACKIAPNGKNGGAGMDLLYEHTVQRQARQIETLERQNAEILGLMRQLIDRGPGSVVVTGNNIVDARKVVINVFGQEGLGHVTQKQIRTILEESLPLAAGGVGVAAQAALLKTALLVYSDPDHPENLTCYFPNKKGNEALVHMTRPDGTVGWEVQPVPLVLPPMAQKSIDALFERQPYDDARAFEPLVRELRDNEQRYATGSELRPILVRNKGLLSRAFKLSESD